MMKMSTPFAAGKMPYLWALSMLVLLPFIGFAQPYNGPCSALLYDFGGGQGNIVPCGPSANTTPQVAIDGQGTHDPTGSNITLGDLNCGGTVPGDGGSPDHVLWVTFVIQEGGSFEWQTVPGPDDYTYILYYSGDPVVTVGDETSQSGCGNLIEVDCGNEFTGWKIETTPDPTKRWRFYLVFYLRNGDQTGSGVVKIRKSCGLACEGSEPTVDIQVDCDNTSYTLTATSGFDNYVWSDANGVLAETSNVLTGAAQGGTYTVVAYDDNSCPGSATVTVPLVDCCEAEAGTITNNSPGPFTTCTGQDLIVGGSEVIFSASGNNVALAYAFLLVDASGNIVASNTNGNFGPIANAGTYTVYGLSFDETLNAPQTIAAYLGTVSTIAEIEASTLCLDLVSGAPGDNVITVKEPSCGTFPN